MNTALCPLARALGLLLQVRQLDLAALDKWVSGPELDRAIMELVRAGVVDLKQTNDGRTVVTLIGGGR